MRFQTSLRAAIAAAAILAATGATAQDRNVMIHNKTGITLYRFYSTNSGSDKWGKDVMGQSTLPSGRSMRLNFDNKYGYCEFDFRAIFEDGTEVTRGGVNVCEVSDYTYNP
jgi:hypothetical protein